MVTNNFPFGGPTGGEDRGVDELCAPCCPDLSLPRSGVGGVCLADSEPSFDNARGVRGGVFFFRGEATPSVSFVDSRCEVKEESAETVGISAVGVLGLVDGVNKVGFERWVA